MYNIKICNYAYFKVLKLELDIMLFSILNYSKLISQIFNYIFLCKILLLIYNLYTNQ